MDKLLNAVKDFSVIKRYLEAINQTTDDFLYMYDIPNDRLQFFGHIHESFKVCSAQHGERSFEDCLAIVHPADRGRLCAEVEELRRGARDAHDHDFRLFNIRGETVWVNSRGKVLHDENGAPYVLIGRLSEEALRHLFNPLTGLWNKEKLRSDLDGRMAGKGWLMLLGIPALASLNLRHGRDFGDELLREMADILEAIDGIEESYHVMNNHFAVIVRECEPAEVESIYGQICSRMDEKCSVFAGAVPIDSTVFGSVSQLIDSANVTLQDAVQDMVGRIVFFSADDIAQKISELSLLEELKESVQNNFEGFEICYQPQLKRGNYGLHGTEALLRYNSKERGRVFPDEFIPVLEHSGLIDPVGQWVLEQALAQCRVWREKIPDLRVAVNFSLRQFEDGRLGEKIVAALEKTRLPGSALTVELTESLQLNVNPHFVNLIRFIKSYGVQFSIDDFGTGYSNLAYLKDLDVDEIKIDRSFVSNIEKDTYNYRLICNILEFASANSIHTCCEGVETSKELSILEQLQPDIFQGYLFEPPCTALEIECKYLRETAEEYKERLAAMAELCRYVEKYGAIHFNPENILRENRIGLWTLRIDREENRFELHANDVMAQALGLSEKLSPTECYDYWKNRICSYHAKMVSDDIYTMIKVNRAVETEYAWEHPSMGVVRVRSSGIRVQDIGGMVVLEGYHRILN